MAETNNNMNTPENGNGEPASTAAENEYAYIPDAGVPTTPVAPTGGQPVYPGNEGIPTTPVAPTGGLPVYPGDEGVPTTPIAPPDGYPVDPGYPDYVWPIYPSYPLPTPGLPSVSYYSQVRFLNASTNGSTLEVFIDNQNVLSGSTFATVSIYISVTDGFHTVMVRQTSGRILYQQTQAFVSGEKMTMVILDTPTGVTLARVSDMGCTNIPSGYGCCRVANMSYSGSSYDVRLFNNQIVFAGVGYKEVTSYKQAAAGNYTFFVTNSQIAVSIVQELPVIILSALVSGNCPTCGVNNPLLTYSLNIAAGKAYTSYIIGNPWSNLYRVFTLED